jgi:hypothetical protein
VEILNLTKLNALQVRKQYQIKISNRFEALENLSDSKDINRAWEKIKENIKTSAKQTLGLTKCSSITNGLMNIVYVFYIK